MDACRFGTAHRANGRLDSTYVIGERFRESKAATQPSQSHREDRLVSRLDVSNPTVSNWTLPMIFFCNG